MMEADLDLGDKLKANDRELSGDQLINREYISNTKSRTPMDYYFTNSRAGGVLHRPVTPTHRRQINTNKVIESMKRQDSSKKLFQSDGFTQRKNSTDYRIESSSFDEQILDESPHSVRSSTSSVIDFLSPSIEAIEKK